MNMLPILIKCHHCGEEVKGDDIHDHLKRYKVDPSNVEIPFTYRNIREITLQSLLSRFEITKESLRLLMLRNGVDPGIIPKLDISHPCDGNITEIIILPGCDRDQGQLNHGNDTLDFDNFTKILIKHVASQNTMVACPEDERPNLLNVSPTHIILYKDALSDIFESFLIKTL